jgi:hypothetical protein
VRPHPGRQSSPSDIPAVQASKPGGRLPVKLPLVCLVAGRPRWQAASGWIVGGNSAIATRLIARRKLTAVTDLVAVRHSYAENPSYPIYGTGGSKQSMRVCVSGAISGTSCGHVERLGGGSLAQVNLCGEPGDSGAPSSPGRRPTACSWAPTRPTPRTRPWVAVRTGSTRASPRQASAACDITPGRSDKSIRTPSAGLPRPPGSMVPTAAPPPTCNGSGAGMGLTRVGMCPGVATSRDRTS